MDEVSKVVAEMRSATNANLNQILGWANRLHRARHEGFDEGFQAGKEASVVITAPPPRIDLSQFKADVPQFKADVPRYALKVERDGNAWVSIAMKNDTGEWCRWADIEKSVFYARAQQEAEPVATVCLRGETYGHGLFTELQVQHAEGVTFPICTKFYTAPQPRIDLSQFKPMVEMWKAWAEIGEIAEKFGPFKMKRTPEEYASRVAEADRLLALIAEQEE